MKNKSVEKWNPCVHVFSVGRALHEPTEYTQAFKAKLPV